VLLLNKSFESLLSITTVLIALWIVKSNYADHFFFLFKLLLDLVDGFLAIFLVLGVLFRLPVLVTLVLFALGAVFLGLFAFLLAPEEAATGVVGVGATGDAVAAGVAFVSALAGVGFFLGALLVAFFVEAFFGEA
jgi:hypothetical protein